MKALTQTAAPLIVERPDSKQMNECAVCIKHVKSSLCASTSCAHMHLRRVLKLAHF